MAHELRQQSVDNINSPCFIARHESLQDKQRRYAGSSHCLPSLETDHASVTAGRSASQTYVTGQRIRN